VRSSDLTKEPNERRELPRIGIVIPACDEAPCIGAVLGELLQVVDANDYVVAVGVNGSSDATAAVARQFPVVVAETDARGYGHGCVAAIEALRREWPSVSAYIFFAADGASEPRDIERLATAYRSGAEFVLGSRTGLRRNWPAMTLPHVIANFTLALWCTLLTSRWFSDLGPLRLIERRLYEAMQLRELTYGWTIEAQIAAAQLRASILQLPVHERPRIAGAQKVSGVSWRRTFSIGCRIFAAGWRTTKLRFDRRIADGRVPAATPELLGPTQPRPTAS
jgi:glycosyltransferase involved in cell wall biosynthesis